MYNDLLAVVSPAAYLFMISALFVLHPSLLIVSSIFANF